MKADKSKLSFVGFLGFLSLLASFTFLGFFIYYVVKSGNGITDFNFMKFYNFEFFKIVIITTIVVFGLSDLLSVIVIWAVKWESKWCKSTKFILGLLTLFLPFIFAFVFSSVGKSKMKKETVQPSVIGQQRYNNSPLSIRPSLSQQYPQYPQQRMSQHQTMYNQPYIPYPQYQQNPYNYQQTQYNNQYYQQNPQYNNQYNQQNMQYNNQFNQQLNNNQFQNQQQNYYQNNMNYPTNQNLNFPSNQQNIQNQQQKNEWTFDNKNK